MSRIYMVKEGGEPDPTLRTPQFVRDDILGAADQKLAEARMFEGLIVTDVRYQTVGYKMQLRLREEETFPKLLDTLQHLSPEATTLAKTPVDNLVVFVPMFDEKGIVHDDLNPEIWIELRNGANSLMHVGVSSERDVLLKEKAELTQAFETQFEVLPTAHQLLPVVHAYIESGYPVPPTDTFRSFGENPEESAA